MTLVVTNILQNEVENQCLTNEPIAEFKAANFLLVLELSLSAIREPSGYRYLLSEEETVKITTAFRT